MKLKKRRDNVDKKYVSLLEHTVFIDYDDTLLCSTYFLSYLDIDYELNHKTKTEIVWSYRVKGALNERRLSQFTSNLEKVGNAAQKLLIKLLLKFKSSHIKIVTNSRNGWIPVSLSIASQFCNIYKKMERLILDAKIEIIYARDDNLDKNVWKTICFDRLLWRYFNIYESEKAQLLRNVNVITIGDQWTDHRSIEQTLCFRVMRKCILHHQIKLFAHPDWRYLRIELKYISGLLDEEILFKFDEEISHHHNRDGLVLEFDGYDDHK